jgi:hypothetical protein
MAAIRLYFDSCAAAYFQPGSDREPFNQGNAALFCAAMDALLSNSFMQSRSGDPAHGVSTLAIS